jgi:hypothetical protein
MSQSCRSAGSRSWYAEAPADCVHRDRLAVAILYHHNDLRPEHCYHHRGGEQQRSVRGRSKASGIQYHVLIMSFGRVVVRGDRHGNNVYWRTCLLSRFPSLYASIPNPAVSTGNYDQYYVSTVSS